MQNNNNGINWCANGKQLNWFPFRDGRSEQRNVIFSKVSCEPECMKFTHKVLRLEEINNHGAKGSPSAINQHTSWHFRELLKYKAWGINKTRPRLVRYSATLNRKKKSYWKWMYSAENFQRWIESQSKVLLPWTKKLGNSVFSHFAEEFKLKLIVILDPTSPHIRQRRRKLKQSYQRWEVWNFCCYQFNWVKKTK